MTTPPAAALGSMLLVRVRVAVSEPVGTLAVLRSVCLVWPDVRLPVVSSSSLFRELVGVAVVLLVVVSSVSDAEASVSRQNWLQSTVLSSLLTSRGLRFILSHNEGILRG